MKIKKLFAGILAAVMAFSLMAMPAFADDPVTSGQVGGKGSITVLNATNGQDYKAYKVFDASFNGDAISYKVLADLKDNVDTEYFSLSTAPEVIDGKTYYTVSAKVDDEGKPVKSNEEIIEWLKANYSKFDATGTAGTWDDENSTVTFKDIPYGYYYITSTLGAAVTINSANPNQDVYDKNETTPVDPAKTIVSVDGKEVKDLSDVDAHVGSVIGFKITAKTNNWEGKEDKAKIRESWTVTDTPTNMTINDTSVVVKFNGTELAASAYTKKIDASTGALTITVPMTDEKGNSIYPATQANNGLIPIEITYSATIDKEAGDAPAKNEIPGSNVTIETYAFQVAKTDGSEPLPGAQFELWSKKSGETSEKLTFIDNEDGTYTYSIKAPEGKELVTTLDMTTNTTIVVKGLDKAWTYTLKETKVPDGYNQAEDKEIDGSKLTKVEEGTDTSINSTELYKETVINNKGAVLPSTGGMGTTMFYVIGAILMAGAGVVLVSKRRMAR